MHCQVPLSVRLIFTQYSPLQKGVSVIVLFCDLLTRRFCLVVRYRPVVRCWMLTLSFLSCRPGHHYKRRPTPAGLHGRPAICGYRWIIIFGLYAFSHTSFISHPAFHLFCHCLSMSATHCGCMIRLFYIVSHVISQSPYKCRWHFPISGHISLVLLLRAGSLGL